VVAPSFVLRVAVKEASGSRRLLILPPLKLHNLLACDMHYRYRLPPPTWIIVKCVNSLAESLCHAIVRSAFDVETKKCVSGLMSGTLAPGQETDLHVFDIATMKTRLALTIQVTPHPFRSLLSLFFIS
jgi:predicted amidohydrolase